MALRKFNLLKRLFRRLYAHHIAPLMTLAWPLVLSQASWTFLLAIDTVMVGHYSAEELGYLSLGRSFVYFCWGSGFGFLAGVLVYIAQAYGAERMLRAGLVFRVGLAMSLVIGAVLGVGLIFIGMLFESVGIEAELAQKGKEYAQLSAPGLFAGMVFMVGTQFLEAQARPKPVMVISLAIAFINFILNWFLIYGWGPIPPLGANGAALGTSIATIIAMVWVLVYIARLPNLHQFGLSRKIRPLWRVGRTIWRFGLPTGLSISLEMLAFSSLTIIAGTQGKIPIATFEIFITLLYLPIALVVGFAQASAIRVGHAVGARRFNAIPTGIGIGVALNIILIMPFCLACLFTPELLAVIFTDNLIVQQNAAQHIRYLGFILITYVLFYGIANPVRTMGDAAGAAGVQIFVNWAILVPLAVLGVFYYQRGVAIIPPALLLAMLIGGILIALRGNFIWRRLVNANKIL